MYCSHVTLVSDKVYITLKRFGTEFQIYFFCHFIFV